MNATYLVAIATGKLPIVERIASTGSFLMQWHHFRDKRKLGYSDGYRTPYSRFPEGKEMMPG